MLLKRRRVKVLFSLYGPFLAIALAFYVVYFIRIKTIRINGVTKNGTLRQPQIIVADFFKLNELFSSKNKLAELKRDYYFVTPPVKLLSDAEQKRFGNSANVAEQITALRSELEAHNFLLAIAGYSEATPNPACRLDLSNHILYQAAKYTHFEGHTYKFNMQSYPHCICYACDLLPDTFLVSGSALADFFHAHRNAYAAIGEGIHLWFFMSIKKHTAYCPCFNMTSHELASSRDYTCNGLSSRWDQKFFAFPEATGVYGIVGPSRDTAWLTCVWSSSSVKAGLPIACSNLLFRYLVDLTHTLETSFNQEYRIVSGTLLGALRNNDIIPWTADVDIAIQLSLDQEREFRSNWTRLSQLTNWLYDHVSSTGSTHYPPLRAHPRCPAITDSAHSRTKSSVVAPLSDAMLNEIEKEFNSDAQKPRTNNFRTEGYVDIYFSGFLTPGCEKPELLKPPEWVTIRGIQFKGLANAQRVVDCMYGNSSVERLPKGAPEFKRVLE